MARIWSLFWLLVAVGGIVLMTIAYRDARDSLGTDGKRYILFIAEQPDAKADKGAPVSILYLPAGAIVDELSTKLSATDQAQGRSFLRNHQEKLMLFPDFGQRFTEDMLESGRLPKPGSSEVLAEQQAIHRDYISLDGRELRIAGVLKQNDSLQQDAYYAPDDPALREALASSGKILDRGFLVSPDEIAIADIKKHFPRKEFTAVASSQRMDRNSYYNYGAGMLLLLLGGSALLIRIYKFAARHITNAWLGPPLAEIDRHWKLFAFMHAVYFGIFLAGMFAIYDAPMIQDFFLTLIRGQIESESGVLGVAGKAYGTGNIALAAVTTLLINFFLGSLLVITAPSVVVPGIGVFMAIIRATIWGIVLAPSHMTLASGMICHSGTLLLEGEGYLLAAFFAILVPIYLSSPLQGDNLWTRYKRAFIVNIKGNIIVLIVLAVAALYEAVEVILQMG
jgi:hypothetical protein